MNPVLVFIRPDRWRFGQAPRVGLCIDGTLEPLSEANSYLLVLLQDNDTLRSLEFRYIPAEPVWGLVHCNAPVEDDRLDSLIRCVNSYQLAAEFNHTPNDSYWIHLQTMRYDMPSEEGRQLARLVREMVEAEGLERLTLADRIVVALRQQIARLNG